MESSLPANNLVALKFVAEFSDSQYELFEVDNDIVQKLVENPGYVMIIKSYEAPAKREVVELIVQQQANQQGSKSAALCTEDATFRLKKNETSNTMLVASLYKGDIYK